jgi:hypothetical protein
MARQHSRELALGSRRRTSMRMRVSLVAALLVAGCSHGSGGGASSNPVDAVVLPMLHADRITPTVASDSELCRRLAIDLSGVAPIWDDYLAHCQGKTPAQIVDYYMSTPGYLRVNQRLWADAFQYDNRTVWYSYIQDLDAQVAKLYAGGLGYADFATIAVAHPAFVGEFAGENVIAYAYQAFLGRDALPEERQDLLALYRMWRGRGAYDPVIDSFRYNVCTSDADCSTGRTCQPNPKMPAERVCTSDTNYRELYLDPRACAGALGPLACTSQRSAASAILPEPMPLTLGQLSASDWQILRAPGRVIVAQPELWEAAIDVMLAKYLGWWHGGVQLPGYEIPAVRQALAVELQRSGDVRAVERMILTSVLYTQPASEPAGDSVRWHYGPLKQMIAESWLDSVGKMTGVAMGSCDWRYAQASPRWTPPASIPPPGALARFPYQTTARTLGGCPDESTQLRYTDVGVLSAMEQRSLLAAACTDAAATRLLPTAGETPAALVKRLYRDLYTHDLPPSEASSVASALPAADAPTAQQLCQALMRSSRFLFY